MSDGLQSWHTLIVGWSSNCSNWSLGGSEQLRRIQSHLDTAVLFIYLLWTTNKRNVYSIRDKIKTGMDHGTWIYFLKKNTQESCCFDSSSIWDFLHLLEVCILFIRPYLLTRTIKAFSNSRVVCAWFKTHMGSVSNVPKKMENHWYIHMELDVQKY